MTMFQEPRPGSLSSSALPSTMGFTKVKVVPVPGFPRRLAVTWPAQYSAVRYVVYVSPNPTVQNKFREVPKTQRRIEFEPPVEVPHDAIFFFWVAYLNPRGDEVFIQDPPSFCLIDGEFKRPRRISPNIYRDIATDQDMLYYLEEIRRRHLFVNENDGEDFLLFIRRFYGQSSVPLADDGSGRVVPIAQTTLGNITDDFDQQQPTAGEQVEADDPAYQGPYRDRDSFGTGIVAGYFPAIQIRIRYGEMPQRLINFLGQGISYEHDFNSWTIWHPRIKENDVLVRLRDDERFLAKQVSSSEVSGIFLHQRFKSVSEPRSSTVYKISDQAIREALDRQGAFDVARWDWSVWR